MQEFSEYPIFFAPEIVSSGILPEEEAMHALRVLRLTVGSRVRIADGCGTIHEARIAETDRKTCRIEITVSHPSTPSWQGPLRLAVAPTKQNERMEWLVEKAVEIGIDEFVCLRTAHSERKQTRPDRLVRIAVSAMKQSGKARLPHIEVDVPFENWLSRSVEGTKLIAHCLSAEVFGTEKLLMHRYYTSGEATVLIGPEGDFSAEEVSQASAAGYLPISLGQERLRTETAALVALERLHTLQMLGK